jgi:hypothetical protein
VNEIDRQNTLWYLFNESTVEATMGLQNWPYIDGSAHRSLSLIEIPVANQGSHGGTMGTFPSLIVCCVIVRIIENQSFL